jgi:hypothetical protein
MSTFITYFKVYSIVQYHLSRSNKQIESNRIEFKKYTRARVRGNSKSRVVLENVGVFLKDINFIQR